LIGLPELSPINGPVDGLPETDLFVGTHDILYPDARAFAERTAGRVHLVAEPGLFHVYPLAPVPEARSVVKAVLATLDDL
jgi:acetyl esterase/lipase